MVILTLIDKRTILINPSHIVAVHSDKEYPNTTILQLTNGKESRVVETVGRIRELIVELR